MTTRALAHSAQSTLSLSLTININADRSLLFLGGLVWLAWLTLGGVARRGWGWGSWWAGVGEDLGQAIGETWGTLVLMLCPMGQMVAG